LSVMAAKEYCAGFVLAVVWSGLDWPLWTAALAGVRAMRESAFGLIWLRAGRSRSTVSV
jgi:hypothetical protein